MPRRTLAAFDLKAARKVRGLSQLKTAQVLCATQPSVARWEAQGNMPEVFRRLWELYWQLEDMKNDSVRASTRKSDLSRMPSGDKPNEASKRTRSSVRNVKASVTQISSRRKGTDRSSARTQTRPNVVLQVVATRPAASDDTAADDSSGESEE